MGQGEDEPEQSAPESQDKQPAELAPSGGSKLMGLKGHARSKGARLKNWYLTHKKISIPASIIVVLALLAAIPYTRYALAGTVLKQNYTVQVYDGSTHKPVTSAAVSLAGKTVQTNNNGQAVIRAKLGKQSLSVTKKYYKDFSGSVTVGLTKQKSAYTVDLTATGRQVPVVVTNRISGKPVENITISASDTEVKTDKDGKATIVVLATDQKLDAKLSGGGFNDNKITITVSDQELKENNFTVTPAGKMYFLSKQSGKIDVVKTNLDGSERQTILAGTGKEEETGTVLLASRDWKYLALLSRRDNNKAKLYLIETATDKLTTMDEGNAEFSLSGWSDHYFAYTITRTDVAQTSNKRYALKTFNAENQKLATIDENTTEAIPNSTGFYFSNFTNIYLLNKRIVYASQVYAGNYGYVVPQMQSAIVSVNLDGSDKKTLKSFPAGVYSTYWQTFVISGSLSKPKDLYFTVDTFTAKTTYVLEGTSLKETTPISTDQTDYPTYLASPSGNQTFWYEPRDGKNVLLAGDANAGGEKPIAALEKYIPYGWYTDDYILVSRNGSELFILPATANTTVEPIKISDYHKPAYSYYGYGGGYGGL
jgi:hypothetical protein